MALGTRYGLLFGALGAVSGVLLSGAISLETMATLAKMVAIPKPEGPLFALLGLSCAFLGLFVGARRSYADRQQRRRYLALTIGVLALIVVPASLIQLIGVSPQHQVPRWIAASASVLALAGIVFVALLPRLMRPTAPASNR
jgi:hypothetical protein